MTDQIVSPVRLTAIDAADRGGAPALEALVRGLAAGLRRG